MHPLASTKENLDRLYNATEIAVEIGSDEDRRFLFMEWDKKYQDRFTWFSSDKETVRFYGYTSFEEKQLLVKCNFLKVNNCVLMLLQPYGRFCDYRQLEKQANIWLGKPTEFSIGDTQNFYHHIFNKAKEDEEAELPKNEVSFPYGAKSAFIIQSNYHLDQFVQHAKTTLKEKNIGCILLPQWDVKEYQPAETSPTIDKRSLYVAKSAFLINHFVVTLFYDSGFDKDRVSFRENPKQWFPNALYFVSRENIDALFTILKDPTLRPEAYDRLVKEVEEQPIPRIELASLNDDDILDQTVSYKKAKEEINLESHYRQKNPYYKSPQQLLRLCHLDPRLKIFEDTIFPALRFKMNESNKRGFKAELGNFSVAAWICSEEIIITLSENGNDDYITLSGFQRISDGSKVGICAYLGNLRHLCNIIDVVSQNWDIEKFQECNTVGIL